ncbi:TPA: hypothetical protein WGW93_000304 [Neisseria meningitidis]|uniref:hypothetical protein n=1 Tax=Neisseria TaxID=482 RepID=UPI0002FDB8B1|nr:MULTISPECIES: hypothetical protein [Neisseria]MBG9085604.1 hypothetical protein [Neisseria meningitidis]MBG9095434.1 hypothetical protein [Neisseria meningitidis]MBG9146063.1 hypothetical protein [Neisseria meningitidis]MBG9156052.1 hypothetical protein [Neisseria meningitidis]MBG9194694.1 hypothetical protein [Neisseria meningitidis]
MPSEKKMGCRIWMSDHLIRPNVGLRYSGLNSNQYGVASPCRTICTVCGFVALS